MADSDKTEYRVELLEVEDIPQPDNLIVGFDHKAASIKVSTPGDYARGTLLMAGDDGFVAATEGGYKSAECCLLCDNIMIPDDTYAQTAGYFAGTFNKNAVALWENADIDAVAAALRQKNIWLV